MHRTETAPPTLDPIRTEDFWWAEPALRAQLARDPAAAVRALGLDVPADAPRQSLVEAVRLLSVIWQDGRAIAKRDFQLSPDDEGLLFGRGVWESTRTVDGRPWLWGMHLERLVRTAALLNIRVDPARLPDANAVARHVRNLTGMDVVVRLNASAGGNGRPGTVWMSTALPPAPLERIRLRTCPNPVPKGYPYLVWKTFQYATRLQVGQSAGPGFDSTLLVDDAGLLLEAAHANVFFRTDDGWATPPADGGLLPGTVRRRLLENAPEPIRERPIHRDELADVREAFLTNSNVGIVPITRVDDREYPIGDETRHLAAWLEPDSPFAPKPLTATIA